MKELVKQLQENQNKLAVVKNQIKEKTDEFNLNIQDLINSKDELEAAIELLKTNINLQILKEYAVTKNKSFIGGLGVQERKSIVYDKAEVLKWAIEKKMFLSLDTKAFEKVAESLPDVPTVKIEKHPQVSYPKEIRLEE